MTTLATTLQAFAFDSHALRVVHRDGEPWFIASDLLEVLTLDRKALERLDDDEKGVNSIHTPGGRQEMTIVNESGLYSLVMTSRKPEAKRFKKWVTSEVLPAIRKTGQYSAPGATQAAGDARIDKVIGLVEAASAAQAASDARLDKVIGLVEQLLHSGQPQPLSRKKVVKVLYVSDVNRILALRAKGYMLDELVSESGFSKSQCWAVISNQYKVLESGRASINLKTPIARAADTAAKFERTNQQPLI